MTPEDEEFNRIEREAKQRMEAVSAALDKKAKNARELGLDYEPAQHKPMHPEIKKLYEDYFDKCFRESSQPQRTWRGLTDKEFETIIMSAPNATVPVILWQLIQDKLKDKNT